MLLVIANNRMFPVVAQVQDNSERAKESWQVNGSQDAGAGTGKYPAGFSLMDRIGKWRCAGSTSVTSARIEERPRMSISRAFPWSPRICLCPRRSAATLIPCLYL